jgi:hypothetical protein
MTPWQEEYRLSKKRKLFVEICGVAEIQTSFFQERKKSNE